MQTFSDIINVRLENIVSIIIKIDYKLFLLLIYSVDYLSHGLCFFLLLIFHYFSHEPFYDKKRIFEHNFVIGNELNLVIIMIFSEGTHTMCLIHINLSINVKYRLQYSIYIYVSVPSFIYTHKIIIYAISILLNVSSSTLH